MFLFGVRAGRVGFVVFAATCALLCSGVVSSASATNQLVRGFADDIWFTGNGPFWVQRTVATGARRVLIEVDWNGTEPSAPQGGSDPTNPAGPQYSFSGLDAKVREFESSGISPAFLITDAPPWAETPGGPAVLESGGAWRPNATALGQFAAALARRYSGAYPDPLYPGHDLPHVQYYQAWAEPNLNNHLAPQWVRSGAQLVQTGPTIYRGLLNAFYAGVKSVNPGDVVVTGGFGPYGDPPSTSTDARTPPAEFVRELLCLHGESLRPERCAGPAHFDVLAIDPYEVSSPLTPALNRDDVTAPDLGKLTRIATKAVRLKRALPRRPKQLWVTEFSYDSNPPNPTAISTATQAKWLEESFYVFWREGVSSVFWYLVADQSGTDYSSSYFSGVYFNNGTVKPSFEAYRFPFVVMSSGRRKATLWGISPRSGRVLVQIRHKRSWRTLFKISAHAGSVFVRSVPASLHGSFRGVVNGETSLTWTR